jgi:hypothetical protein
MPIPVYILCCESGTDDVTTGLASHFNVVDRIRVKRIAPDSGFVVHSLPLRIVAVWRAEEEGDFEQEFESELRAILLPQHKEAVIGSETFRFSPEKPKRRFTLIFVGLQFEASGQLVIESRIRRSPEAEWRSQRYIVDVVVEPTVEASASPHDEHETSVTPMPRRSSRRRKDRRSQK